MRERVFHWKIFCQMVNTHESSAIININPKAFQHIAQGTIHAHNLVVFLG
jgi:hypothetical protein